MTLPSLPIFRSLVSHATYRPGEPCIIDNDTGKTASHAQLVTDVASLIDVLNSSSHSDSQDTEPPYICVLAPPSYEFAVAFLAVAGALGVIVPLSTAYPLQELAYFVLKCKSKHLLVHPRYMSIASELRRQLLESQGHDIKLYDLGAYVFQEMKQHSLFKISPDAEPDPNAPGLVIFTSGTTGPPKGAVFRRRALGTDVYDVVQLYDIRATDRIMHCMPIHHASGLQINFLPFLMAGACVEFHAKFDAMKTWQRWTRGELTFFSGVPTMYERLMKAYEQQMLPQKQLQAAAMQLRALLCGTSALRSGLRKKWIKLTGGRGIIERYGATEIGSVFSRSINAGMVPEGSVGRLVAGVDAKVVGGGSEGELLIRRASMFLCYLNDADATDNSHDDCGFFKTGDVVKKIGDHYFILGRISVDIIKSGGYKISALDIEREMVDLDYVSECTVIGVPDAEFGERVAAAVVLHDKGQRLSIGRLRADLSSKLARYKLPTLLRIVDELPLTSTGKVAKKRVKSELFKHGDGELQVWNAQKREHRL